MSIRDYVFSLYREKDFQEPLKDVVTGEVIKRVDYLSILGDVVNSERLERIRNYINPNFEFLETIVYLLYSSQEHFTIRSRNRTTIPPYYIIVISRMIEQVGIKRTIDDIMESKSLRVWSLSVKEMIKDGHVKSKKMDMARQENERVKVAGIACRKCKSKNTVATSKQTRGGDEQETAFVKCIDCNEKWVAN